jgi:hypothetical protein
MTAPAERYGEHRILQDPEVISHLFATTRWAVAWLALRSIAGWMWLSAGWSIVRDETTSDLLTWSAGIGLTIAGIAMILGLGVGLVAFVAILLGINLDVAGPWVVGVSMLLIVAWKTAGWIGLDRWALPTAVAPWRAGSRLFRPGPVERQEQ